MNNTKENELIAQTVRALQDKKKVFGIKGLSEFLNCSYPTASRIASRGLFQRYRVPGTRQSFFFTDEILDAMK